MIKITKGSYGRETVGGSQVICFDVYEQLESSQRGLSPNLSLAN